MGHFRTLGEAMVQSLGRGLLSESGLGRESSSSIQRRGCLARVKYGTVGPFVGLLVQLLGIGGEREVASGAPATGLPDDGRPRSPLAPRRDVASYEGRRTPVWAGQRRSAVQRIRPGLLCLQSGDGRPHGALWGLRSAVFGAECSGEGPAGASFRLASVDVRVAFEGCLHDVFASSDAPG